jgi:hypothetical protein
MAIDLDHPREGSDYEVSHPIGQATGPGEATTFHLSSPGPSFDLEVTASSKRGQYA